jgi:hypothetical protein
MDLLAAQLPQAVVHREAGQGHSVASARWGQIVLTLTHRTAADGAAPPQ